jgi:hypothetical protein
VDAKHSWLCVAREFKLFSRQLDEFSQWQHQSNRGSGDVAGQVLPVVPAMKNHWSASVEATRLEELLDVSWCGASKFLGSL